MTLVENHNRQTFVLSNLIQVLVIHLVAIAIAPFYFTWGALLFAVVTLFLFGYSMGIFHHMYLTHRSFKCARWVEQLGSLFGTLTWRGPFAPPIQYVAMHKIHHAYSDTELDPHTPTKGVFFALMSWFWQMPYGFTRSELYSKYVPEMANDSWYVFLDRNTNLLQLAWGVLCFLGGWAFGDIENGVRFLLYGVFVRALFTLYLINAVDLINHTIGYRSYETKDNSTNSFIMAAVHLGGAISWHNNHHAHQHYFTVKARWWEFDVHHRFLQVLSKFGWVSDIVILDEVRRGR